MTSVNWNLLHTPDIGNALLSGFERGREVKRKHETESALAAYAKNPGDTGALNALMALDPDKAMRLSDWQHKEQGYRRDDEFRSALSEYGGAGGFGHRVESGPNRTIYQNPNNGEPPAGMPNALMPGSAPDVSASSDASAPTAAADSTSAKDRAFLRMWEADPAKAMEIDSKLRDQALERMKVANEAYGFAIQNLANVSDEASYQAVRNGFLKQVEPLGVDIAAQIPDRYPGPDGVRSLLMRAVSAKDQIAALNQQDRTSAYIDNLEEDNDRADRDTDSRISDRVERRGLTARGQNLSDARGRRGQNIASADRHRGQDMSEQRSLRTGGGRGRGGSKIVSVQTPEQARALKPGTMFRTPNGQVKVR